MEVPRTELSDAEWSMVSTMEKQGHLTPICLGLPGFGMKPSALIFIIPETE